MRSATFKSSTSLDLAYPDPIRLARMVKEFHAGRKRRLHLILVLRREPERGEVLPFLGPHLGFEFRFEVVVAS